MKPNVSIYYRQTREEHLRTAALYTLGTTGQRSPSKLKHIRISAIAYTLVFGSSGYLARSQLWILYLE